MRERIHRTLSADGTEIAGRVVGDGPPLVLVHGAPHDGDLAWRALLPHLTGRFTCHVLSTRGRGLSGDGSDHSFPRLVEDVDAFLESIGAPVGVIGWSSGGRVSLGVAARSVSVAALVLYETGVWSVTPKSDLASWDDVVDLMGRAAAEGRLVDAIRAFHAWVSTDDEMAALEGGFLERCADQVPTMLREFRHAGTDALRPTDPEILAQVTAPVLLLRGGDTRRGTCPTDASSNRSRAWDTWPPWWRRSPSPSASSPSSSPPCSSEARPDVRSRRRRDMSESGWRAFLDADGVEDWVVCHGGATAVYVVGSVGGAAALASAVADVPGVDETVVMTLGSGLLTVRLTRDLWQLERRHIDVARAISAIAASHGVDADRSAVHEVQLAIAARPDDVDLGFWRAVLGYSLMGEDNVADPLGHGSTVWMQPLEVTKPLRHAMHVDVSVAHEEAERRLAAALAAGGRIVDDSVAPRWWTLSDRAGNRVCIASWPDRPAGPSEVDT